MTRLCAAPSALAWEDQTISRLAAVTNALASTKSNNARTGLKVSTLSQPHHIEVMKPFCWKSHVALTAAIRQYTKHLKTNERNEMIQHKKKS